jgi:hypothetical protein
VADRNGNLGILGYYAIGAYVSALLTVKLI